MIAKKEDLPIVLVGMVVILGFYGVFFIYPILAGIHGSFHEWHPIKDIFRFTGFQNYARMLRDDVLKKALVNTAVFALFVVVFRTYLALLIALGINSLKVMRTFVRAAYFIPVVVSMTAISLIWSAMYDPHNGIINSALAMLGVNTEGLTWLTSSKTSMLSIIIMFIWKTVGLPVVVYLAGLSNIPRSYIEAAKIDGAHQFAIFHRIIIPQLGPPISALGIFTFLWVWDDLLWPYLVLTKEKVYTLPVGLVLLKGYNYTDTAAIVAAAVITMLPVMLVFLLAQRRFIEGMTFTGVKG